MTKKLTISPVTRLEGHGKIDIFLDEDGNVKDSYFQVVELRGFEKFCQGRPVEELPRIMPKICGVCPGAHHMASAKAADSVYKVDIPKTARSLRELYYNAHIAHSHMLHFFALAAPDFIMGPEADKGVRNILGVTAKIGKDIVKEVLKQRGFAQKIQQIIAGHAIHPVTALPGGMSKRLLESERQQISEMANSLVAFSETALKIWHDLILNNPVNREMIESETFRHETYYMGTVDSNDHVNFYDGDLKVVDPSGAEFARFPASEYLEHISEHVESWTYLKFPYLKNVGWKGMIDGKDSGVYRVNSLARLNVSRGMATPRAQKAYEEFFDFFKVKPVHNTLAFHWARLVETVFACEEIQRLSMEKDITDPHIKAVPDGTPSEGIGIVEAPRGTLIHHYETDPHGIVKKVNLIVATVQNNSAINMSVKKVSSDLIHGNNADDEILNKIEMAFRAYDPCLACASHYLPGQMPLDITIYKNGIPDRKISRNRI